MSFRSESASPSSVTEDDLTPYVRMLLEAYAVPLSDASIHELRDDLDGAFSIKSALEVLNNCNINAQFGKIKAKRFNSSMCPCIAFTSSGDAIFVSRFDDEKNLFITQFKDGRHASTMSVDKFLNDFSGYLILAKQDESVDEAKSNSWFFSAFAKGKWLYFQVIIAAIVSNFLGLSTSLFIMVVYDQVVPNEAIESLIALTIGVSVALFFDFVIKSLRANFIDRAGQRADSIVAKRIFNKLLQADFTQRTQSSGAIASVVKEFDTLREFFTSATLVAVVDLPFIFLFVGVIYLIAGPLAVVPLAAVPLVFLVGLGVQPFLARIASSALKSGMSKQSVLIETLNGMETVKATGSGKLMLQRFERASAQQSDLGVQNRMFSQFAINFAASVQQFAQIATIFYGVFLIKDGIITMGAMIAAVILGGRTLAPLGQLAAALTRANSARQAYRALSVIMTEDQSTTTTSRSISRPRLSGGIEFQNVSLTMPGSSRPIIHNFSLKVPPGQKVAIVGKMGSGKSTIVRLAAGLIHPTDGAILLDGVDIRQISRADVVRNVGVMLQESWLFSGSVRENIQMGYNDYNDEHLLKIAKLSGVDDFIGKHPEGYDLNLKEHGGGLSGGQKQSINLARALIHSPSLLILDEPTSSMDSSTEAMIVNNLKESLAPQTMIIVTHRNSLLALVDRVIVVDGGRVVLDQTPDELKKVQGAK